MNNKATFIKASAALTRELEKVVSGSKDVVDECPSGHDVFVCITIQYIREEGVFIQPTSISRVLKKKLKEVLAKSLAVRRNRPFDHGVQVNVAIGHVSKGAPRVRLHTNILKRRVPQGPRMMISDEPFTDEYFEVLFALPLRFEERRFVRFFQDGGNKPVAPIEWIRENFPKMTHVNSINWLCRQYRVPVSFVRTGDCLREERIAFDRLELYKLSVMEPVRRGRKARG